MVRRSPSRANALQIIIDALRRNNRLPHALLLGIAAAFLLGSASWLAFSLGMDALAYIEQHGWEKALERVDAVTRSVWDRTGN